jgi:hypothetical protein
MNGAPPLIGFFHFCMNFMQLRQSSEIGKNTSCAGCGSILVVREERRFGRAEWESCEEPAYLRDALAVLGIVVSRRKRRLIAVALARRDPPDADSPIFQRAVQYAESEAEIGHPLPDREELESELLRIGGDYFPCEAWHGIAEACLELTPRIFPQGLGFWSDWDRILRDIFRDLIPNPFLPLAWKPEWFTSTVRDLATHIYDARDFGAMPILADALQDAGCDDEQVLAHCRASKPHARGCWVVDAILGKE